jgi:hypothetical protein
MRSIHLFLVGYFVLVLGIGVALWQVGVLSRVAPAWIVVGALIAIGVGIMMAVSSGKSTITESIEK